MSKTAAPAPTPAAAPAAPQRAPALPVDEFHGVGGSYVLVDGKRTRVAGPALPEGTPQPDAA